jgi:hypothetical protein
MRKMRLRNRRNRNLGMPAMILGAVAGVFMARSVLPELVRFIRLKSM